MDDEVIKKDELIMKQITNINEIQDILFQNLLNFKRICEKYQLKYYLSNGTLLGAIKYKGFIPWDDDVDVFMPRDDYERLMNISDFDTGRYELLSKQKNELWKLPFAKISDRRTIQKETSADFGLESGVAIDIFPLDNWSGSYHKSLLQAQYCGLLRRFYSASLESKFSSPKVGVKRMMLYMIWLFSHVCGTDYFYHRILNEIKKGKCQKLSQYKGCVVWSLYGKKEVIPQYVFEKTVNVLFRDEAFPAPAGYDKYLRSLYGDYSLDPPLDKQKSHHNIMVWWKEDYE